MNGDIESNRDDAIVEAMLRNAAPNVPELTRQRDAEILASALGSRRTPSWIAVILPPLRVAAAAAVVTVVWYGSVQLFSHPEAPPVNGTRTLSQTIPVTAPERRVPIPHSATAIGESAGLVQAEARHTTAVIHRGERVRPVRRSWAVGTKTVPAVAKDPARILVVSVKRPPVTAVVRNAGESEPGYARAAAWSPGEDGHDSVVRYTSDGNTPRGSDSVYSLASDNGSAGGAFLNVSVSNTENTPNVQKGSDQ